MPSLSKRIYLRMAIPLKPSCPNPAYVSTPLYVESSRARPFSLGIWRSLNPWASLAQRDDSSSENSKNRQVPEGDRIAQG